MHLLFSRDTLSLEDNFIILPLAFLNYHLPPPTLVLRPFIFHVTVIAAILSTQAL